MTRYFYNSVTDSCEEFVYGGCEGNGNRFATKNECLKTCGSPVNDVCKLPVDSGSCFSYVTRYFYNFVTKKCEAFTYGGCEGNGNRFASIDECLRTCGSAEKPGFCRVFPPDTMGICALLCFSDADCPGAKKCCSVGCGLTCQTPTAGEVQHSAGALQSESCLPLHGAVLITRHKGSLLPSLSAGRN
ncbi:chelonianin-like isoform X3 [Chelonoidis abingdonii]|uniref:chelonianin-like isoform X3 n=1 Tax=Chelonoidis abingdonii TaxID=106734 RepID=UPI003F491A66